MYCQTNINNSLVISEFSWSLTVTIRFAKSTPDCENAVTLPYLILYLTPPSPIPYLALHPTNQT